MRPRWDPDRWLDGVFCLELPERGAYVTVLSLIYAKDGVVPDDDDLMADHCRCAVATWRRIKERLLVLGKLVVIDGTIRNPRADKELGKAKPIKPAGVRKNGAGLLVPLERLAWPADALERFWAVYPRQTAKGAARKALASAEGRCALTFEEFMERVGRYAVASRGAETRFVCHPATWLNQDRWEDGTNAEMRRRSALDGELDGN